MTPITMQVILSQNNAMRLIYELVKNKEAYYNLRDICEVQLKWQFKDARNATKS